MANKIAVANKRADADKRLSAAVEAASLATGIHYVKPTVHAHRHPELAALQLVESVADFLEKLNAARTSPRKEKPQ